MINMTQIKAVLVFLYISLLQLPAYETTAFYWENYYYPLPVEGHIAYRKGVLFEDMVLPVLNKKMTLDGYYAWLDVHLKDERNRKFYNADGQWYLDFRYCDLRVKIDLLDYGLRAKSNLSREQKHNLWARLFGELNENLLSDQEYEELNVLLKPLYSRREIAWKDLRKNPTDPQLQEAYRIARHEFEEELSRKLRHRIVRAELMWLCDRLAIILKTRYLDNPKRMVELFELCKIPEKTHFKNLEQFIEFHHYHFFGKITPEFWERYREIMREREQQKLALVQPKEKKSAEEQNLPEMSPKKKTDSLERFLFAASGGLIVFLCAFCFWRKLRSRRR